MDIERAGLDFYDGSRMFERVADKFQMSVDLVSWEMIIVVDFLINIQYSPIWTQRRWFHVFFKVQSLYTALLGAGFHASI